MTKTLGECLIKERCQHRFFCYPNGEEAKEKLKNERGDIVPCEEDEQMEEISNNYCIIMSTHTRLLSDDKSGEINIYHKKDDFLSDFDRIVQWMKGCSYNEDVSAERGLSSSFEWRRE